ncbi:Gfo/Idh/MocA family protein [Deinococcus peraridilitoris]|uniref:Putative dehydrogenase n=1 Tax=Deinococcus peraridilitoris (strain DSM 19664 / LMG 22246 / CIP 109416 / KR-200) TaxID=937777 RepID=L0A334_DEIPD|nr:Gfo/Idh/MocA family oxidoreductase [Deinococcus peraridilitoris]AFZ68251.1 putative dehydrogenase [Deinococcus peraridilitoris DSM 19664]
MAAPVEIVMLGAGNRGHHAYGTWALAHPQQMRVVAVAERDPVKRARFAAAHGIAPEWQFADWRELLSRDRPAPAAIIALPDLQHEESALAALGAGYHLLLEKPIASTLAGTLRVVQAAREAGTLLMLGYVLRHTPFFRAVREVVRSGRLGEIVNVEWRENVHALHFAHSYVRGNWAREEIASPMLLAKASHDLDLLGWSTGLRVARLASFGNLKFFRPEYAPPGAPRYCLDGCPAAQACPFYAPKTYLTGHVGWPTSVISPDLGLEAREDALRTGPYGRCVFQAGNDVVDHQVISLEFEGGASGSLTVHGHSGVEGRTLRFDGTRATLRGSFTGARQELNVQDHDAASFYGESLPETISLKAPGGMAGGGHGGGDSGLMQAFVAAVRGGEIAPLDLEVDSHLLAFAAEKARRSRRIVELDEFKNQCVEV